jgi:hypothetical protein
MCEINCDTNCDTLLRQLVRQAGQLSQLIANEPMNSGILSATPCRTTVPPHVRQTSTYLIGALSQLAVTVR